MSKAVKPTFLSVKTICQKKVNYNICRLSSWTIVQSKYKIKAKYTSDMQWTHLQHCQAPFPSWCPGSTPAQVPCAWRPSEMVRMSFLIPSFYFSIFLFFQLYFSNLSLWLPTWSTILLPAWMTTLVASTPWTVSPSCTSGEAVTAVVFFSDFCFSSGYQSCGLKGKFTAGKETQVCGNQLPSEP